MADEIRRLIRVRTRKGASFKRDGFGKKPQLASSWRKPRGQHNKQREQKKAKGNLPKPGFGSPLAVRGMHPSGYFEILVHNISDLEGLNPKTQAVRIASTVGDRKRGAIQEKALAAGLRVLNVKIKKPVKKPEASKKSEETGKEKTKEPVKKEKAPAEKKKSVSKTMKETKKPAREPAPKKGKEPGKTAENPEKPGEKEQKPKAKAEAGSQEKPKKTVKPKAEPSKETKNQKKTASKPAVKPKKKTSTGVKDNE